MNSDRLAIAKLVALGKLDESYITSAESAEISEYLLDCLLDKIRETNPSVFYGVESKYYLN